MNYDGDWCMGCKINGVQEKMTGTTTIAKKVLEKNRGKKIVDIDDKQTLWCHQKVQEMINRKNKKIKEQQRT